MYAQTGRTLERPAEVLTDRHGELILVVRPGLVVNERWAKAVTPVLEDVTTYASAAAHWALKPYTPAAAATILGTTERWLRHQAQVDPTLPHQRLGSRLMFLGEHIAELQQRSTHGELHYTARGGRRPHPGTR